MLRFLQIATLGLLCTSGYAQAVQKKQLLICFGAGAGVLQLNSDRTDLAENAVQCGAIRFDFGYALGDRWSLGIHYDRVGTAFHSGSLDRLHLTTYLLQGSYRPWIGQRAALELNVGIGATAASLFPHGSHLPYVAGGSAIGIGARYIHLFGHTMGSFIALDHAATSSNVLTLEGGLVDPSGTPVKLQWNSQRIAVGLLVRF